MKLNIFLPIFSLVSLGTADSYCPSQPANHTVQRKSFSEFITKFYINHDVKTAFTDHMDEKLIEHNPNALSGRANAIKRPGPIWPLINTTIINSGFANGAGFVNFREDAPGAPPNVVVDVLRFNGSCIVEHWDVSQAKPANATNPLAMWA